MPYMPVQQRAQGHGARLALDPHDGGPCTCDWSRPTTAADLAHRRLPRPDQSRYGAATTDPLGREAPGWRIGQHGLPVQNKGEGDRK